MNLQTLTLTVTSAEPVAEAATTYSGLEVILFILCGVLGAFIAFAINKLIVRSVYNEGYPATVESLAFHLKLQGIDVSDKSKYDNHVDVKMRRLEDRVRQLEAKEEARK